MTASSAQSPPEINDTGVVEIDAIHRDQAHCDYDYAVTYPPERYPRDGANDWHVNRAASRDGKDGVGEYEATYWLRLKGPRPRTFIRRHFPEEIGQLFTSYGIRHEYGGETESSASSPPSSASRSDEPDSDR